MMIATTCLTVTFTILIHGQVGNSHFATFRQATDSFKNSSSPRSFSVGEMKDRLEIDEGSGIMDTMLDVPACSGTGDEDFTIDLQNPSGCYIFQTTGFNMGGYPNSSGSLNACDYTIQFGATVSGTVTVKEKDFQFQEPSTGFFGRFCEDFVRITFVDDEQQEIDNSDSDDRDSDDDEVQYCGTITEDKIRDFSNTQLAIRLAADETENGNGAEIVICIT